jgi:heat-inducible transcriptional repressor
MREEKALYDRLLRNAILLCEMSIEGEETDSKVSTLTAPQIFLANPISWTSKEMRELFRTFEEKSRLIKILNECISRFFVSNDAHCHRT